MKIIDAYAHVSLPRFLSAEEMLDIMDQFGVEQSLLATADTCPDLSELSRAQVAFPQRFRSVGMPMGDGIEQIKANMVKQLEAGFIGIRLPDSLVLDHPILLDIIGERGGTPFIVGSRVLTEATQLLVTFLNQYPQCHIAAPHFAGVPEQTAIANNWWSRVLLGHQRFLIIFSRQGFYSAADVRDWARHLVGEVGWSRLLFGSEYPVCVWRDETFDDVINWIDKAGLRATESDRQLFFHDNAARVFFNPRKLAPQPLADKDWLRFKRPMPVWYFPQNTLDVDEETHRRLITAWYRVGGGKSLRFSTFLASVLRDASVK